MEKRDQNFFIGKAVTVILKDREETTWSRVPCSGVSSLGLTVEYVSRGVNITSFLPWQNISFIETRATDSEEEPQGVSTSVKNA